MGPFDPDVSGHRFLLTVFDHATTYSFVFPMKSRTEVPNIIIALVKKILLHFNSAPKFIRCDNAKEYTVQPLSDYLDSIGSKIIFTSPYTPEQNGEVERLNCTLGDIAQLTLAHSGLPSKLWSYAYRCACYLVNRLLNQRCKTTPLEMWSGRQPEADSFYPFGAWAAVHIPKERRRKLDQRGWTSYHYLRANWRAATTLRPPQQGRQRSHVSSLGRRCLESRLEGRQHFPFPSKARCPRNQAGAVSMSVD